MADIRVEYLYNKQLYRFNGDLFDAKVVNEMTKQIQNDYAAFAKRINEQNGYLEINLSHTDTGIHYETFLIGVTDELRREIDLKAT